MPPQILYLLEVTENSAVMKCGLPLWRGQLSAFDTLYFWTMLLKGFFFKNAFINCSSLRNGAWSKKSCGI